MKVFVADREQADCRHCKRRIRRGQVGLVQHLPNNPYTDRHIRWHASCIQALLDIAPPDSTEESFNALRAEMLTTGTAFPGL